MKLGIYGGTFNPIHKGHIHYAKTAMERLGLDKVLLMVDALPPHKTLEGDATAAQRLEMCRLAVAEVAGLEVSDLEIQRGGKSYTVDTLYHLKALYPDAELFLLLGTDMFLSLDSWKKPDEIKKLCTVVGAPRLEGDLEAVQAQCEIYCSEGCHATVLPMEPIEISSSEIREGQSEQLDEAVQRFVIQNGLYGEEKRLMLDLDELTQALRSELSRERFEHSLNVANEAIRLADRYDADKTDCYAAGLLHDFCKEWPPERQLKMLSGSDIIEDKAFLASPCVWHGFAAASYLRAHFGLFNTAVLDAVRYHTTACPQMTLTDKIVFMADLTSAERQYSGVEALRTKAHKNLDAAVFEALQFIMGDLAASKRPVLALTAGAYNQLLLDREEGGWQ